MWIRHVCSTPAWDRAASSLLPAAPSGTLLRLAWKSILSRRLSRVDTSPRDSRTRACRARGLPDLALDELSLPILFIGNPPYVRHHRIADEFRAEFWKILAATPARTRH